MTTMNFRKLIDMAIGSPEPGHVNFNALHCLLNCIADKLNIIDETVDYSKYDTMNLFNGNKGSNHELGGHVTGSRLFDGTNADEEISTVGEGEVLPEPEVVDQRETAAANVTPEPSSIESPAAMVETHTETIPESTADAAPLSIEVRLSKQTSDAVVSNPTAEVPPPTTEVPLSKQTHDAESVASVLSPSTPIDYTKSSGKSSSKLSIYKLDSSLSSRGSVNSCEKSSSKLSIRKQDDPSINRGSAKSSEKSSSKLTIHKLDSRIFKMEMALQKIKTPADLLPGISIMKDQLELAVEQLLLLTFLTLSKKPDLQQFQQLYTIAQSLHAIRKENIYFESSQRFENTNIAPLNWRSSGLKLGGEISEVETLEDHGSGSKNETTKRYELEGHLCYSPEKMLDQLMDLKCEFCLLTNKVNELSARLLQQESQGTIALCHEMREQMRDLKLTAIRLTEHQDRMDIRIASIAQTIENIKKSIEEIIAEKVDKAELEILLADKVDYNQLQRKVSLDEWLEIQCRIEKKFSKTFRLISENDKKFSLTVNNLQNTIGLKAIDEILKAFKEQIEKEIHTLHELLQKYIDSSSDECAASGTRIKVLQDLACLSCDANCVMRTMQKAKVAKLPSAHASNTLSPLITFELRTIRKSGKDGFPHTQNAWMNGGLAIKRCVARHAGGSHTTSTAKERIEKVMLNKK